MLSLDRAVPVSILLEPSVDIEREMSATNFQGHRKTIYVHTQPMILIKGIYKWCFVSSDKHSSSKATLCVKQKIISPYSIGKILMFEK